MQISQRLSSVSPSATLSLNARTQELKKQGVNVISLAVGEPDFNTPAHVCEAAKAAIDENFCRYTAAAGIPELRSAVGQFLGRAYGVPVGAESVIVGVGGKQCLYNFMQATLNPGDEVLIPSPYWLSYTAMTTLAEACPVTVPATSEQAFKVTPDMLESKRTAKTRLLLFNSPNNPTGAVYSQAETDAIVDWAIANNIYVLADEMYNQLVYAPARAYSLLGAMQRHPGMIGVVNGLSKSFAMTGWRVGFLVADPELVKKVATLQGHATSNICSIAQKAALAALTGPTDFVDDMRAAFNRRRDLAMDIVAGWPWAVCPKPDGAFYLFVDVHRCFGGKGGNSSVELCEYLLDAARVAVVPGSAFGDDRCIRFSYAVADEVLVEALGRVGEALSQLVK